MSDYLSEIYRLFFLLPLSETDIQIPFFPERNDDPERTVFTKYDLFSDIRLRSGNQRRASGYGISRRAVHHAADRFTCRVPHPGIHGMHPLPVRDSAKHLYRPFQQRTGTGERVSHAPCRHGYVFPFAPFYQRAQNVPQQRTPVCGIPESQADGVVFPAQLLLYIERDRLFLCTYI